MKSLRAATACLCTIVGAATTRAADGDQLAIRHPAEWLAENLVAREQFRPYPTAAERPPWEAVDATVKANILQAATAALAKPWAILPATRYLDFTRDGDRSRFQALYFDRRQRSRTFALAESLEDSGRFTDEAMNGIWLICEESTWVLPAHLYSQRSGTGLPDIVDPTVDLFAAETAAQLAWSAFLLGGKLDAISPLLRARIELEIDRRVLTPFLTRDDYSWMGFKSNGKLNNWTPWIVSNVLTCALLVERDPARRVQLAHRCLVILDNYIARQPADGGCDEGPGYWDRAAGSTFDTLELYHLATDGKLDGFSSAKVRAMAEYIYRAKISEEWFVNFADASPKAAADGALCFRFGERLQDPAMMSFGAWYARRGNGLGPSSMDSLGRTIPAVLRSAEIKGAPAALPLPRDTWWPDLQVMTARSKAGSGEGLFLAAKGGHNAESHNHNDVGSCIVFADGRPILIDPGVGSYTRQTFSSKRYDIWTMQSAYHNLPVINGMTQSAGRRFAAREVTYHADDNIVSLNLDFARAYRREAKVKHWRRAYVLDRPGDRISITDEFELEEVITPTRWHFLVPVQPSIGPSGEIRLYEKTGRPVILRLDRDYKVTIEPVDTSEPQLRASWGDRIYRIVITDPEPTTRGTFVLAIEHAR